MIENAKIISADISMEDHGVLCTYLTVEGNGWGVTLGGYVIGKGYLGAKEFIGYSKGTEEIMRIMDTVGVSNWNDIAGKYIRVELGSLGETIHKFGHIIEDKWYDYKALLDE